LLLSTVLGAMVMGSVVFLFANMAGSFDERETGTNFAWADNGGLVHRITIAPSYSQLPNAIQLQNVLMEAMQSDGVNPSASCVYVLGGTNEQGPGSDALTLPNAAAAPPVVLGNWFSDANPSLFTSASQFKAGLTASVAMTPIVSPEDFSIFVIKGVSNVDLVIHCRRTDVGVGAAAMATYTVRCYINGALNPDLSYAFSISAADADAATVRPGAVHYWLRQDNDWSLNDDLGAQVVFPDPTAVPYQVASGDVARAFSRFVLFLPTKP
jgi:hypothetical protein